MVKNDGWREQRENEAIAGLHAPCRIISQRMEIGRRVGKMRQFEEQPEHRDDIECHEDPQRREQWMIGSFRFAEVRLPEPFHGQADPVGGAPDGVPPRGDWVI